MSRAMTEKIVDAAKKVFQQKGYKEASMVQIAKEAGVSIGTLYAYFHNKEQLFEAIQRPELKKYNPDDEIRKQNILNTALKTFSQKGYASTTMDEIAASCGCSKTVLYQFFSGKEDLFAAVFSNVDLFKGRQEFTVKAAGTTLHDFLKMTGTYFLELFEDPDRLGLMRIVISEINSFPQAGEIMYSNTIERVANEVAKQLAIYAQSNVIIETDLKLAARSFLGMLYSFVLTDKILYPSVKQFTKEQITDFAVGLFENGLKMDH